MSFDHTGNILASSSADLSIKLWNYSSSSKECMKTLKGHEHNVSCVTFTPSGDYLYSCSRDKTIKKWDVNTGYCTQTITGHDDWVRKIVINDEGTMLLTCSSDQVNNFLIILFVCFLILFISISLFFFLLDFTYLECF